MPIKNKKDNMSYNADSIKVLKGLEAVKKDLVCILVIRMMEVVYIIWFLKL